MHRVKDPADPRRCKGAAQDGQCMNEAEHGSDYCRAHSGVSTAEEEGRRIYHLAQARYRTRLAQLSEHEEVKSLREEIALNRMLIEQRFNLIKNETDLLAACGQLNQMLLTVERLVKSAHQIEQNLGVLLSKPTVLRLGQQLCEIIVEELVGADRYEERVDRICERLIQAIAAAHNPESK